MTIFWKNREIPQMKWWKAPNLDSVTRNIWLAKYFGSCMRKIKETHGLLRKSRNPSSSNNTYECIINMFLKQYSINTKLAKFPRDNVTSCLAAGNQKYSFSNFQNYSSLPLMSVIEKLSISKLIHISEWDFCLNLFLLTDSRHTLCFAFLKMLNPVN